MLSLTEKFTNEIARIKDPLVFIGIARILNVSLMSEKDPKNFEDVLVECIEAFDKENRARRKELLKVLKDANKCKENTDADSTENSTEEERK